MYKIKLHKKRPGLLGYNTTQKCLLGLFVIVSALQSISAQGIIILEQQTPLTQVVVVATEQVILRPGFHAVGTAGSFNAKIGSANSMSPFIPMAAGSTAVIPIAPITPSSGQNYIVTTVPYQPVSNPATLTNANSNYSIQYFDGLGRLSQTVQQAITTTGADLVSGIEYDDLGHDYRHWLPGAVPGNNGAYVSEFSSSAITTNKDNSPYSTTKYDGSPLNRVTGQYGAGEVWYNAEKKNSISYPTNSANDVICFAVNSSGQLVRNGFYDANTLYATSTTDEDAKTTAEYKDRLGRVVMKRSEEGGHVDTYYVYNDLGQLSFVLPPRAVDGLGSITKAIEATNDNDLGKLGYAYQYDTRGNCIYKKLPGCDPVYMVYDRANRLVLSQDGNQRVKGYWTQLYYDVFGKMLYSMEVKIDASYEMIALSFSTRLNVDSFNSASSTMLNTGYSISADMSFMYRKPSVPGGPIYGGVISIGVTLVRLLVINYYDGYDYINLLTADADKSTLPFIALDGYDGRFNSAKGLLTGTKVYHLEDPTKFEVTSNYYDKYGRVVQTRSSNHLGGYDISYNKLDFRGKVLKTRKEHKISGQAVIPEVYRYAYDKAERLIMTQYKLGANDTITLVSNSYDDLGRVTTTLRHNNKDNCSNEYNIRNWKTNIKSGTFEENLYYNTNLPSGATANYNGNIAYSTWTYNDVNKGYVYSYDGLNRLTNATFKQGTSAQPDGYFDEKFTYDSHGNITTLKRKKDNVLIDDLAMNLQGSYIGNQLQYVNDNGISQHLYDTKEYNDYSSANSNEFNYDYNGNMIKDSDRNIVTIRYNILNLPDTIQFKNGNQIKNTYDADGHKLGMEYFTWLPGANAPLVNTGDVLNISYSQGAIDQNGTAYIGNFEYNTKNGNSSLTALNRIHNTEGYVENISGPNYYYYRKDHLGDNREVWLANTSSTVQRTQYYPSGLPWASNDGDNPGKQQRKYNGKEFIEMQGYDTYDYGARGYYAASGRFMCVDPLAEKYYSMSPYAYCAGNPVRYVDVKGQFIVDATGNRVQITYNDNGTLSFSRNADVNTIRMSNAMNLTESGRSMLKFADNSSVKTRMIISSDSKIDGKKSTNGETEQGNKNRADNFGIIVNSDGTYGVKNSTITVYEGTLKENIKEGSGSKLEGLTMKQAIGAVAGHETVHATNKSEINKDVKAAMRHTKRTDGEVKANQVEQKIIDESKKQNNQ